MREIIQLRVDEEFAPLILTPNEGRRIGETVRLVDLECGDIRLRRFAELQMELRRDLGRPLFFGWKIRRVYSEAEKQAATFFNLTFVKEVQTAGEEHGTIFSGSAACEHCGAGEVQCDELALPKRILPKGVDFFRTLAGELVLSRRAVDVLRRAGLTGLVIMPVKLLPGKCHSAEWQQMTPSSFSAVIATQTRVGIDPFDEDSDGRYRCTCGRTLGLNVISELYLRRESLSEEDFQASSDFVGVRRGLLRPERQVLVTRRAKEAIEGGGLAGAKFEIVRLSDS